jgi:chromosome segregation ATPase
VVRAPNFPLSQKQRKRAWSKGFERRCGCLHARERAADQRGRGSEPVFNCIGRSDMLKGSGSGLASGRAGPAGKMQNLQKQLQEIEQQVSHKNREGGGRSLGGGDAASQAVLMAELQTVRHLLTDASMAMAAVSQEKAELEEELNGALDELRTAKQSWQAAEMSLRVQSEAAERLNAQVSQLTEELRSEREKTNKWIAEAERARHGDKGSNSEVDAKKKEIEVLTERLDKANQHRMQLDKRLIETEVELEALKDTQAHCTKQEQQIQDLRQTSNDYRAKSETYQAELLAWRSKSEAWEVTKAQSMRSLQSERDRLQTEWQTMRESLQSAEASLAVQTAAVQRLEQELLEDRERLIQQGRMLEGWTEKEEAWTLEVHTMRTRMESESATKDNKIKDLNHKRDMLEQERNEYKSALQSAEASLAVQTAAVQRVEKQASTLMIEVRQCRRSEEENRQQAQEALASEKALQIQLNAAQKHSNEAKKELHDKEAQYHKQVDELRKKLNYAEASYKKAEEENARIMKETDRQLAVIRGENEKLTRANKALERFKSDQHGAQGSGGSEQAVQVLQEERKRLLAEVEKLRPKLSDCEIKLASNTAMVQRLEADLQQHKFLLGEAQGNVQKYSVQAEALKTEVTSLRMQMEDATARAEHAIATLREERDLLHSELERLRNSLQAASAEMNSGLQSVAKLSNVDARTVSSQVRVYGETQGMQNQLHMQMDAVRTQIGGLRVGGGHAGRSNGGIGGQHAGHGFGSDEFRPAAGRVRRTRFASAGGGRPDGGAASAAAGAVSFAGPAAGALRKQRPSSGVERIEEYGTPDGGMHADSGWTHVRHDVAAASAPRPDHARDHVREYLRPASARVHRPSDRFVQPPARYTHKEAGRYDDLALVEQAAEWLAAQRGRNGMMPSDTDLRAAGMCGVADAILRIHGGTEAVATKLGMQIHYTNACAALGRGISRDPAHWAKFSNIQQAVLELAQSLCSPDTMPSYMALRSAGLGPVADAIRAKHGGLQKVAQRLGLQLSSAFAD